MIDLFSDDNRRNPYPLYDQLRAASPVLHAPQLNLWMIFDYDGVKRALADHESFTSQVPAPNWLVFRDPPRHTKLRALISQAFTPRSIAGLEPRIRELSRQLLDQRMEHGEMDLAADFSVPLPMAVIAHMLGIPGADLPRYKRWSDVMLEMSYTIVGTAEASSAAVDAYSAVTAEMNDYLVTLLDQRRVAPKDDLLTRLVQADVDGGRLTQEEILGFFQLLLVAGQETTANLINDAMLCFIENPEQLARLRREMSLLPSAIEEVLRYRSPLQWMMRGAKQDIAMHGRVIPAGSLVLVMIGSANRDPQQFSNASSFDIAREPNPHLAFGHGVHFCLGAPLARLEARIALTDLLVHMESFELAGDEPWPPRKGLHVHGPSSLPIHFVSGRRY